MEKNRRRTCAVCGEEKSAKEFGDGSKVPYTTCLKCKRFATERSDPKIIMYIKNERSIQR